MKMKQVLHKCQEYGYPMTRMGIYVAGKKYGFIVKNNNDRNLEFNQEKFMEWLEKAKEEIPEGYLPIIECSKIVNKSLATIYNFVKEGKVDSKCIGAGKGIIYVNVEELKRYIHEREYGTEEKFGN